MAELKINLNFIPKNLDEAPLLGETLSKTLGRLLCEKKSTEFTLEKYLLGKELFEKGTGTFLNTESEATQNFINHFKVFCENLNELPTEVKGQILIKFI